MTKGCGILEISRMLISSSLYKVASKKGVIDFFDFGSDAHFPLLPFIDVGNERHFFVRPFNPTTEGFRIFIAMGHGKRLDFYVGRQDDFIFGMAQIGT